MTLFEQSNRTRFHIERTSQYPLPDSKVRDLKPKRWSFYDESLQDMKAMGKSAFPYSGRNYIVDLSPPTTDRDANHIEKHGKRRRKRPAYRQSVYHSLLSTPLPIERTELTARGRNPEPRPPTLIFRNNEMTTSVYQHNAPPPTPSYDESERMVSQLPQINLSSSSTQKSSKGKEKSGQFRLPALNLSILSRQTPKKLSAKEVRSTLANYLQNYY